MSIIPVGAALVALGLAGLGARAAPIARDAAPPIPYYSVTDLGTLPGTDSSEAIAINSSGQVLCRALIPDGQREHAFLWEQGTRTDLGSLSGAADTYAHGLNDAGQVAASTVGADFAYHAAVWQSGSWQTLSTPGDLRDAEALAINGAGTVVGDSYKYFSRLPISWSGAGATTLPLLSGYAWAEADGVNDAGLIAATAWQIGPSADDGRGYLWDGSSLTDLGVLPGYSYTQVHAINNHGAVVGACHEYPNYDAAFLWSGGTMTRLPALYFDAAALGLNDSGAVVGWTRTAGYHGYPSYPRAALWLAGEVLDLNHRIADPNQEWVLSEARGINEAGQVVGVGTHHGRSTAFLLNPLRAALTVTVSADRQAAAVGDTITFTATIRNSGPDDALNVYFSESLSAGLEGISFASPGSPADDLGGRQYDSAFFTSIPAGSEVTTRLVSRAISAGTVSGKALATALDNVSSDASTASASLTVAGTPQPELRGTWGDPVGINGGIYTYFAVWNQGTAPSAPGWIEIYAAASVPILPGAHPIRRLRLPALGPNDSKSWNLNIRVSAVAAGMETRLIAIAKPRTGAPSEPIVSSPIE